MSVIAEVVLKLLTPKHMLTKCIKGFDSENSQCVNQVWSGGIALTDNFWWRCITFNWNGNFVS